MNVMIIHYICLHQCKVLEKSYNKLEEACQLIEKKWFDNTFINYYAKDGIAYKHLTRKKRFKLTENNISSRVLNHWVNKGIFHDDREDKKGWKVFGITDTMLLTIIKRLRHFGLDLDRIKKITDYLYSYNYLDEEANCLLLDFYIAFGMMNLEFDPINLIINGDGDAVIVRQSTLTQLLQMGVLIDYLVIDLKEMLAKGSKNEFRNISRYSKSQLERSELEKELQNSLQKDGIKNIIIKIKDKDYTVTSEMLVKDKVSANALMNLCTVARMEIIKNKEKQFYKFQEIKKIKKNG